MNKEEELLVKRIQDLAKIADLKCMTTFSDFLNLNEQNIFHSLQKELYTTAKLSGGYEQAERQMVAFHPDALAFTWEYPIDCLRIEPKALKFSEELSHRDYLGALLNLGVDRSALSNELGKMRKEGIIEVNRNQIHYLERV